MDARKRELQERGPPPIQVFLRQHPEFGLPVGVQTAPDWAKGRRQWVRTSTGRSLLFYLQNGEVVAVKEDIKGRGRENVWDAYPR